MTRCAAKRAMCATPSASRMSRRSASWSCSDRTPSSSSSGSTPTAGAPCRSDAVVTGSCCARTAWRWSMTGTTTRLGEQHFFMTTTTDEAPAVARRLTYCHQVLWPDLDLHIVPVVEQWAGMAIAGPRSRQVLAELAAPLDVAGSALPCYGRRWRRPSAALTVRILRISYSRRPPATSCMSRAGPCGPWLWERPRRHWPRLWNHAVMAPMP